MKKSCLFVLLGLAMAACSLLNSDMGPKMVVTCQGVSGSLTLTAQEATQFVKDVKSLKKDTPICLRDEKTTAFCVSLLKQPTKKCSANTAL